nr:hypothetical protein StreXyl84_74740 [Streptomyces sp. Xyl84]
MIKNVRFKAVLVAAAAAGSLLGFTPSASAAGNCDHYGQPGYIQMFTGGNFTGNCYETYYWNTVPDFRNVPNGMNDSISSVRSWSGGSFGDGGFSDASLWTDQYGRGLAFTFHSGESWPNLPSWINDKASSLY